MELKEAKQWLNDFINIIAIDGKYTIIEKRLKELQEAVKTVLQALEDKENEIIELNEDIYELMNEY